MITIDDKAPHECVVFENNVLDSHAAYSKEKHIYTIVLNGAYIVSDKYGVRKIQAKAGDVLKDTNWVLGEHCGLFYSRKLKELEKKKSKNDLIIHSTR